MLACMRRARPLAWLLVAAPQPARPLSNVRPAAASTALDRDRATAVWRRITDKRKEKRSLDVIEVPSLAETLRVQGMDQPARRMPELLQVNIGLTCNLACSHCHVESSPSRAETMSADTVARILELLEATPSIRTVDITGGAPEMHAAFGTLVRGSRRLGLRVIDRCNLTILKRKGMEHTAAFLAENGVDIVASLPCYSSANVEKQRGNGVFLESIEALQLLNSLGYGAGGDEGDGGATHIDAGASPTSPGGGVGASRGLRLDLVYNPGGAFLPPKQEELEKAYKAKLWDDFGIRFDSLFCITNMPIKRFADELLQEGRLQQYMDLLVTAFNPSNVDSIMCRSMVHVAYDGSISDCDFHYALDMPQRNPIKSSVFALKSSFAELAGERIQLSKHCWGCMAGSGSS